VCETATMEEYRSSYLATPIVSSDYSKFNWR